MIKITTDSKIGDKHDWYGKTATITGFKDKYVAFSIGEKGTGYTHLKSFLSKAKKIEPKIIPKKTLKTSSAGEHQDILQLPKEGSTKLYTIIAVITLIIIFFEAKIFKKLVK